MTSKIVFFDTEVSLDGKAIIDIGAVDENAIVYSGKSIGEFGKSVENAEYLCGHNIVQHDMKYVENMLGRTLNCQCIDTLYLSPLLFPKKPYHKLLKDDKLDTDQLNNPVNDSKKAKELFFDEINAFNALPETLKSIYFYLLHNIKGFSGFFNYLNYHAEITDFNSFVKNTLKQEICNNSNFESFSKSYPMELAYAISLINTGDYHSIIPPWVVKNNPQIENIIKALRSTPCHDENCVYCKKKLDTVAGLKKHFGFESFRTYNGQPLQKNAADAAIEGKSLLAIFPTGGGKSITFQVPALMDGENSHGLTVVISPLQSLMKDQVDNLKAKGIDDAVYINGLLSPLERKEAIDNVEKGLATMLYISPEQLRSRTIEKLLIARNVVRFVIDEAHCFSSWGHDFRVDYLYIGKFIRELQQKKHGNKIAISCFTATAKQKVISDICEYFKKELNLDLQLFASTAERKNLHYKVINVETDENKYSYLRNLIQTKDCPTIVYVSRTKRTLELAEKLTKDGFPALAFNGRMETNEKLSSQDAFMHGDIKIIVATSAFGMGVDKSDVGLVIHYDISDSLENYVQEAGRAGRDQSLEAECYVLYNDNDLDKHFILLNQTKLSIAEIQQVWKAIKELTKERPNVCCSALEIARQAGWNEAGIDIETRVRTAIATLEEAGFIERGKNIPRVYATSINANSVIEASQIIDSSDVFKDVQSRDWSKRIISALISSRSRAGEDKETAESRVDYLADRIGLDKKDVIDCINTMREANLLKNESDMEAYIFKDASVYKSKHILDEFAKLENYILSLPDNSEDEYTLKSLNEGAINKGIASNIKNIRTLLYFLSIKGYLGKIEDKYNKVVKIGFALQKSVLIKKSQTRINICNFIIERLFAMAGQSKNNKDWSQSVVFSMVKLFNEFKSAPDLLGNNKNVTLKDFEEALLYLSKIGSVKLEGGFLVVYNSLEIKRLEKDNKVRFRQEHYKKLNEFYQQKIRQIHIVGEFANLMVNDYDAALKFVQDYFLMDFKKFINKYFKGERAGELERNITAAKYNKLFGELSEKQRDIINDSDSKYIVVAAGPGSGKTMLLVHKLASLLQLENVKHEQLLMLTFSRAAATEFKFRLMDLIGNAANFVEIKTFHSYCFDLLGRIGNIDDSKNIVKAATQMIKEGNVEANRIAKSVLVIDEAQDMSAEEFRLVKALMDFNEDMRVIAVGDDDQNIYEFRGSSSENMKKFIELGATKYEMIVNYRSKANIVALNNIFVKWIKERLKNNEIQSYTEENGIVEITHYNSKFMLEGLVENVMNTHKSGQDCVLTQTNDEALQVHNLLIKKGIPARLIQSADRVKLSNVVEIKDYISKLYNNLNASVISEKDWEDGRKYLQERYAGSTTLEICNNLLGKFEKLYPKVKYISDFEEYVSESNYEDFYDNQSRVITVSTIHKSKGKQFDKVYMLLDGCREVSEDKKRQIYVGMTRAKEALYIHCNTGLFADCNLPDVTMIENTTNYKSANEIALQLEYKDFFLDYSFKTKNVLEGMRAGEKLELVEDGLKTTIEGKDYVVAKFSNSFKEKLSTYKAKGYEPIGAEIRFIVSWTKRQEENKNQAREVDAKHRTAPILLANLFLRKIR